MHRLYGLPALVAALTILANGFASQPLISTPSINSSFSLMSLNPKKIAEISKETFLTPGDQKSLRIFPKGEPKKISTNSNQINLMGINEPKALPRMKQKIPQVSLTKFYSTATLNNRDSAVQKSTKNSIKSELITKFHEPQTRQEIHYSTPSQISNLRGFLEGNYANEHLSSSRVKFPEVFQQSSKVQNKFDNLTVLNSSPEKEVNILSLIPNGSEMYANTLSSRNSERSRSDQFSKANNNRDSPQAVLAHGFNQLKAHQSSFTIKKFPQGSSPSLVTTDSKTPNSGKTTVNAALNKQPEDGESSTSYAITVNGNSEIALPKMVNKDSSIGEAANLLPDGNKFANGIRLPTPSKNIFHKKEKRSIKSKISSQTSVFPLLKSDQKSRGNRVCKNNCLDQETEIQEEKGIANSLPSLLSVNLELISGEIDEQGLPQKLKESIKPELCKVSSLCPPRKESTQPEKRRNSENRSRKGKKEVKSVFSLKYATTEPKRDLGFVVDESKVKDFNNNAVKRRCLKFASSLKLDFTRVQTFDEKARVNRKLRSSENEVNTLNDARIPHDLNSESQLNYPYRKGKVVFKSLQSSDTRYSLKDQLQFSSTLSYEENTPLPNQYIQFNRIKGRRSSGVIFSNSSNDDRIEKGEEASDPNFIVGQIRNYALDQEESKLENGIIKEYLSEKNLAGSNRSRKIGDLSHLDQIESGIGNINESFIVNNELIVNKSLNKTGILNSKGGSKINETLRMNQTGDFNITLAGSEGIQENSTKASTPVNQWPVKHSAVVEGDLVLGGLMMVHEREDTITCGPVMPQGGVQALEAMLYTLDRLNSEEIVPGVKIGAHILDDCDKDTYGLEMAVDFIKGSISNIDGAEYHCNKTTVRKVISGVVGAASSVTSVQVANLLRLFRIPQVSFFSTSPELSNKQRFEYFTRTIPSDHYQVKAMVDIVRKMRWSYVSIIYEESNYGIKAFEELEDLLAKYQICIAIKEKLVKDSGVAEEIAYDNIVQKLLTKPRARGCIIFGSDQEVAGVMRAVRRCNATGTFSWIGSDGWSARGLVSNGNEPEVEGTLSVQPQANPVKGFEEYFLNLTVENNKRNPWFVEFWEDHFQCRYPNASWTPYNQKYTKPCTMKERLTKQTTAFEDQLQFVSDAVMAFAYAFRNMHKKLCHGKKGLCDAMRPTRGIELLHYLKTVEFEGLSGDDFKFDSNGDGPARYNIIHFKQTSPGVYNWIRVGKYLDGKLLLNMSEVQFNIGHPQPPESVCSLPCEDGQAKKYVEGERCCWHCFNCTQYQIRDPVDETQCIMCAQGTVPDETHTYCRDIPEEFLRPESGWAIGAMSFSASGILMTLFVVSVFLKFNDTPVVRASGRELSYVLLSGILLCYLVTFTLILRPSDIVCGIQRFTAGFCFTVVYAALLTKTNRISRIFNVNKHSAKRPSFISPKSQLIICSGLVSVQILINGVWMIIDPARAMHHYPTREDNLLVCNSYINASYMIAFTYPIILIVICTVYAVLTRKIPEAFNESKHIGFTMYTTCVIWLAFVPLYFGTGNHVALRITSMSITISLSASVTIACLFSPKLYIILIRPERNVRQSMMPNRHNTTKSSAMPDASNFMAPLTLSAVTCDQNVALNKHIIATTDNYTQSENYEMESMNKKNGKAPPSLISRSTQTLANNHEGDSNSISSIVSKEANKDCKENSVPAKELNTRIGNGPVSQNDVPL